MDIKVKYKIRKMGHLIPIEVIDVIFVEDDSNDEELDQQIKEHLSIVWNDNSDIVEISSLYLDKKNVSAKTGEYEIIGDSPLTKK